MPVTAAPPGGALARLPALAVSAVPWREMAGDIVQWDALAEWAAEPNPFHESWR